MSEAAKPALLVLASTYPRWKDDPEPAFVHELCRRLTRWFDVTAVVPDAPGADPDGNLDGVHVVRFRYAPRAWQTLVNDGGIVANLRRSRWKILLLATFIMGQWWAARRIMRQSKIRLVHAHWLLPQGLIAAYGGRLPFVVTSHGGDLFGLKGRIATVLKRKVAARASAMTVVSSVMAEEAARVGLKPPSIDVIPMGADLAERFREQPDVVRATDELLFVGRLVSKKGVIHLIDAMPAILARRPGVHLKIVGFGPEEATLRQRVQALGLGDRVVFVGAIAQKELPAYYARASVFVAPFVRDASGDQEGLPVALMEAAGCGCPVVVGDVPGVRDLLGDLADRCSVDGRNPAAIAQGVLGVLAAPAEAAASAALIRRAATSLVDWDTIAARYARCLLGAVDSSR